MGKSEGFAPLKIRSTHANGGTIGFACDCPEKARIFHDPGVANGGKSIEDPPGCVSTCSA